MKKSRILFILLAAIATFLLVYSPHYRYPFPRHADEWHHITEAIKLQRGEYSGGAHGFRIGFHLLLLLLSKIANLVLIYRYLPVIWAVFSSLVLFYVIYKKTDNQFSTALFAIIFFASIKSNVNITGLWFFNSLTFSIPFIYLYVYFFTEGIEKENNRFILASLAIMVMLVPVHSISVLFAIPFLFLYSLSNFKYIVKKWKFFSGFLIIPLTGMVFFKFMAKVPWKSLAQSLIYAMQFRRGWGVLELKNSPFELYSLVGYFLAIIGIVVIFSSKKNLKRYLAYGLWPITVLASIIFYRIRGVSYLSPYQRNLYYFAISLPLLSALGLDYLFKVTGKTSKKMANIFVVIIIFFAFWSYWRIPERLDLYEAIDKSDYQALLFLSSFSPVSVVMAPPGISEALYPVSGHWPVATYVFYGNRRDVEKFFNTNDCSIRKQIIKKYSVRYVLSKFKIDCGWKAIYSKGDYIYEVISKNAETIMRSSYRKINIREESANKRNPARAK